MSEAFAFASPVKLERQAHCMCYTCTSCCFEHPKPSRWFGRQKEKYGSVFHCLLIGILNVEWKEHVTLSFCWNRDREESAQRRFMFLLALPVMTGEREKHFLFLFQWRTCIVELCHESIPIFCVALLQFYRFCLPTMMFLEKSELHFYFISIGCCLLWMLVLFIDLSTSCNSRGRKREKER